MPSTRASDRHDLPRLARRAALALVALVAAAGAAGRAGAQELERSSGTFAVRVAVYDVPEEIAARAAQVERTGEVAAAAALAADLGKLDKRPVFDATLVVANRSTAKLERTAASREKVGDKIQTSPFASDRVQVHVDVRAGARPYLVRLDLRVEDAHPSFNSSTVTIAVEQILPCADKAPTFIAVRATDRDKAYAHLVVVEVTPR